jgi:zinc transporter ZupT
MVGGIHLSCEEHYGMNLLFVVLIHKALMSCAFGTLLESSTAPRSMFLYFMLTYGFSSTVGILTGTLMSKFGFVTPQLLRSMRGTDLVVTALTAGVYLFIAAMKMIPAGLTNESSSSALEKSEQSTRGGEKTVKFVFFVTGFLAAVIPKLLLP